MCLSSRKQNLSLRGSAQALSVEPTENTGLDGWILDGNASEPANASLHSFIPGYASRDLIIVKSTGDTKVHPVLHYLPLRVLHA